MEASRLTAIGGVWSQACISGVAIAGFALLFGLAFAGTGEDEPRPTAAQSALLVAGLVVLAAAVVRFGQVTGENSPGDHAGTVVWMALAFGVIAAYPAFRLGSAICTLAAALAFGLAFVEFVHTVFNADRANAFRWLFLVVILVYASLALVLRGGQPRDSTQLVNAAMVAVAAILGTIGFGIDFGDEGADLGPTLSTWWELVVLAVPLSAIGYALLTRQRGPAWSGSAALLLSVLVIGQPQAVLSTTHGSLKGWPIVLLALAALTLGGGLIAARRT